MDLDLALRVDEPPIPTESSVPNEKIEYERWERSNRSSLAFIKSHRSSEILEIIHTNTLCINGQRYSISFIDETIQDICISIFYMIRLRH